MLRLTALFVALASPALSQCLPLPDALNALAQTYGEAVRADALMSDGSLLIITADPNGGWSALVVSPAGETCMVANGQAFEVHELPIPGENM